MTTTDNWMQSEEDEKKAKDMQYQSETGNDPAQRIGITQPEVNAQKEHGNRVQDKENEKLKQNTKPGTAPKDE